VPGEGRIVRDARSPRHRGLVALLALGFGWLVVQNTVLFVTFVWMRAHGALATLAGLMRIGSLVIAAAVVVASAMALGAALAFAVARGRRTTRAGRMEVHHV
jgi:hypothetical protein